MEPRRWAGFLNARSLRELEFRPGGEKSAAPANDYCTVTFSVNGSDTWFWLP